MNEENRAILGLPLVRFAPFLVVGMLAAYYGGSLVSAIVIGCSAVAFLVLTILKKPFALNISGLLCGALVMFGFVKLYAAPVLEYSERTVQTEFVVDEIVTNSDEQQQLTAWLALDGIPTKARLFCKAHLEEGQRASAVITFWERDSEWETYNLARGTPLSGEAEILSVGDISLASGAVRAIRWVRRLFADRVREYVSGDAGELALSILFGMDEQLPTVLYEKLRICGAAHFTAVSGTHFSVFAALLLGLIPANRRRERAFVSLLFTPIAVIFFGASSSVIRASAMFLIYSLNGFFFRQSETLNTLCVAVTAICLLSPASAIDLGFQMSVLGVFGTGVVGAKAADRLCQFLPQKWRKLDAVIRVCLVSICAVICTSPLSAAIFKGVSVAGALTSIVMVPLMGISFFFAIALGLTGIGLLSVPLAAMMKLALLLVDSLGGLRGLWLPTSFIGAWIIVALLAAAVTVLAMGSPRWIEVSAGCAAVLSLFLLSSTLVSNSRRFEVLSVENTKGSAQVVISGSTAKINISHSSGNFSKTLLQSLRENGTRSVSEITVEDKAYSGTLTTADLLLAFTHKTDT